MEANRQPHDENAGPEDEVGQAPARKVRVLPFSNWWPLAIGAFTGIVLRLVFSGEPGGAYAAMEAAFVYLVPIAVGAVTVYVAEAKQRRTWSYCVWAPMVANTLFVLGTMAILIEGLICAIIILPLFCVLGAFGGVVMGAICRATRRRREAVYSFTALPVLLGLVPINEADYQRIGTIERTIVVEAPPQQVWRQIHDARDIRPEEIGHAWMYRIGVPPPIAGVTHQTPAGFVRKVSMGKSIHFEQVAAEWQENRYVRWHYRFDKDSFPPHALDDHVTIGGHYFDLLDTAYKLTPTAAGATEMSITMRYRVSTQFNWYADGVARLLIGNFEEVILDFYRRRAVKGDLSRACKLSRRSGQARQGPTPADAFDGDRDEDLVLRRRASGPSARCPPAPGLPATTIRTSFRSTRRCRRATGGWGARRRDRATRRRAGAGCAGTGTRRRRRRPRRRAW